ncbi:MAG: phosphatase PAP2 family protein [Rhodobacteraceae bacterium]|nr:phosphatase PAP2 family protein [Paracoccaceae bacterium]
MSVPKIDLTRSGWVLLALWLGALVLFRTAPGVDLFVTGQFYSADTGFSVLTNPLWEWLRQRIWDLAILVFLASLICWPLALWKGRVARLGARAWGFVLGLFFFGPIVIVNGLLKSNSGRARPADVDLFGGTHHFSIAGDFTDQCARNCSFVSGEVSAAVALSLVIWLGGEALRDRLPRWGLLYIRATAVFISAFITLQRVGTGRHFLSDAFFAGMVSLSVAWLLWGLIYGGWLAPLAARLRLGRRS